MMSTVRITTLCGHVMQKKTRSKSEPHQVPSLLLANGGGGTEVDEPLTSSEPQAEPDTKPIEDGQEEVGDGSCGAGRKQVDDSVAGMGTIFVALITASSVVSLTTLFSH